MRGFSILLCGVLTVIAVLAVTSVIIAAAPFLAGALVITGLIWFFVKTYGDEEFLPEEVAKSKKNP